MAFIGLNTCITVQNTGPLATVIVGRSVVRSVASQGNLLHSKSVIESDINISCSRVK